MERVKLIATDLDGTLLNEAGQLSERTRKSLEAAREAGVIVVALTARLPRGFDQIADLPGVVDAVFCANGAVVYEPGTGAVEITGAMPMATAAEICDRMGEAVPDAAFAVETGHRAVSERRNWEQIVREGSLSWDFVDTVEEVLASAAEAVTLKAFAPGTEPDELLAAVQGLDLPRIEMHHWGEYRIVDFNRSGVNKGTALAGWCAERDIDADEVAAFGDMPNDVPMLRWAGRSWAMGEAHPEAVAVAGSRAPSSMDDGVAQVVEGLLDERRR
jgi:Cof subfamily protein (haloacid dehalogenase superfamily)